MVANYGMGPFPLPWSEIEAFCRLNMLPHTHANLIRKMSAAYHEYLVIGSDPLCIEPWEAGND